MKKNLDPRFRLALCKRLFAILLLAIIHLDVAAQSNEFVIPITRAKLSARSVEYESKVKANHLIKKVDYVKISSLKSSQKEGNLSFSVPGYSKKIHAKATYVNYVDDDNYEWRGETNNGLGSVILICEEGKVAGHISLPDGIFSIYPFPDGDHIVTTMNTKQKTAYHCGVDDNTTGQTDELKIEPINPENARLNPCPVARPVRVLFLVTPEARAVDPNINNTVSLCVSQFNSSITRSAISSGASIESAGIVDFSFLTSDDPNNDMLLFTNNANAKAYRDTHQADVVVLLTNANYSSIYGIAPLGPINDKAYAIVQITHALFHKTFVHEVGHLYGGKHHNDYRAPSWAKAFVKKNWLGTNIKWRTVMYGDANTDTQLNFSNPNVSIDGDATGTSTNNNARRLQETYATVRAFRNDPPMPLTAYVTGPTEVFTIGSRAYEAVYSCGLTPYSFSWSISTDGLNFIPVSSTSETYTHWFYSPSTIHYVYIRVKVTDGSGAQSTNTLPVYVSLASSSAIQVLNQEKRELEPEQDANVDLTLFPNPSDNATSIMYTLPTESDVELVLVDSQGIVVKTLHKENQKAGKQLTDLRLNSLRPGLYQVILRTNQVVRSKRLLVKN